MWRILRTASLSMGGSASRSTVLCPTVCRSGENRQLSSWKVKMTISFLPDRAAVWPFIGDERNYVSMLETFLRDHIKGQRSPLIVLSDYLMTAPYDSLPFVN